MIGLDTFKSMYHKVFGTHSDRELKKLHPKLAAINALEKKFMQLNDDDLRAYTARFRQKLDQGASVDDILVDAFAVVRETGRRTMNMRHYDVQLIGGIVLHESKIAEMRTGEGKTLTIVLAAYLNALNEKGVHIVTVNDYLAKRDSIEMGVIYNYLGLTSGFINNNQNDVERKQNYNCDVTYATNSELSFDYLRDNMKYSKNDMVQRDHFTQLLMKLTLV